MRRSPARPTLRRLASLFIAALIAGCGSGADAEPDPADAGTTALTGARIIDGTGSVIDDGVLLVQNGRVRAVGPASEVEVPVGVEPLDVTGRTIIPGLVNAHGHVGGTLGLETDHYTTDNLVRQLELYADYGVTTVVSLGGDGPEGVALRDGQDTPDLDRARVFVAGEVVTGASPEKALEVVDRNIQLGANFIKIRIDDNLGTTEKMTPDVYQAVIDAAHEAGLPVAAHIFYLEDAKAVLAAGADFIAHSVRDTTADDAFITALVEADVCYSPTLLREVSTFVYAGSPAFFDDPFFQAFSDMASVEVLKDPERQAAVRERPSTTAYMAALDQATANLGAIAGGGAKVAMGTDTGPPGRFQGYFEHLELGFMAESGMDPMSVIVASTGQAAACMGLEDVGSLEPGNWADFLVLSEDPLINIGATRSLEAVYIAGNRVPR